MQVLRIVAHLQHAEQRRNARIMAEAQVGAVVIACNGRICSAQHVPDYRAAYRGIQAYSAFFAMDEPGYELAVVQTPARHKVIGGKEREGVVSLSVVHGFKNMDSYKQIVFELGCSLSGKLLHGTEVGEEIFRMQLGLIDLVQGVEHLVHAGFFRTLDALGAVTEHVPVAVSGEYAHLQVRLTALEPHIEIAHGLDYAVHVRRAACNYLAVLLPEDFGTAVIEPFGYSLLFEAAFGSEGAFDPFVFLLEPYHLVAQFLALWGKKSLLPEFHEPRGVLAVEAVGGLVTRTVASVMGYIEWLEAFRSRGVVDLWNYVGMVHTCCVVGVLFNRFPIYLCIGLRADKTEGNDVASYCKDGLFHIPKTINFWYSLACLVAPEGATRLRSAMVSLPAGYLCE